MTGPTQTPYMVQAFRQYADLPTRLLIYAVVFLISTCLALFLDLRLGVASSSVLLVTGGVVAVLLLAVPVAVVALRNQSKRSATLVDKIDNPTSGMVELLFHIRGSESGSGLGLSIARDIVDRAQRGKRQIKCRNSKAAIERVLELEELMKRPGMTDEMRAAVASVVVGLVNAEFDRDAVSDKCRATDSVSVEAFEDGYEEGINASTKAVYRAIHALLGDSPKEAAEEDQPMVDLFFNRQRSSLGSKSKP